jgi:hypothetical protein
VTKSIGILCKTRKYLNTSCLLKLYYAFIYPNLTYCIEIWGCAYKTNLESLFKQQKKAIRIIALKPYQEPSLPLFRLFKILNVSELYENRIVLFMFKFVKGNCPSLFNSMFKFNEHHQYNTRQNIDFNLPKISSNLAKGSIGYMGAKLWNKYIHVLDNKCSLHTFKRRLKMCIMSKDV